MNKELFFVGLALVTTPVRVAVQLVTWTSGWLLRVTRSIGRRLFRLMGRFSKLAYVEARKPVPRHLRQSSHPGPAYDAIVTGTTILLAIVYLLS